MGTRPGAVVLMLCLVLLYPGMAAADSAPLAVYGAGVMPIEAGTTSLVAQHVVLQLLPGDSPSPLYAYHHYECRVRALFELVSPVDEVMLVGYPVGSQVFGEAALSISSDRIEVRVDGVIVGFQSAADAFAVKSGMSGERWIAWEVKFPAGQSRFIEIEYTVPIILPRLTARVPAMYVLRTGAGWQGPIGYAHVRFESPHGLGREDADRLTPGYTLDDRGAVWEFHELEPDFNIHAMIDNPLVRRDLDIARSLARGQPSGPGDAARAARVLAAIGHELNTGAGGDQYLTLLGLDPDEFRQLVHIAEQALADSDALDDTTALIALLVVTGGDEVRLFSLIERALIGGVDLSWIHEQEPARIAARARAASTCREQDRLIARALGWLVAGWAEVADSDCLVIWDDVVDRTGQVTQVVRVSIHDSERSLRLIAAGFPPTIGVRWSLLGPMITLERTVCPEQMGALACSVLVYSLVGPEPGARELAADMIEFAALPQNRAAVQYGIRLPWGSRLDGQVPPGYLDADEDMVIVRAYWPRYPFLWPITVLVLVVGWVIWRRRRSALNKDSAQGFVPDDGGV